MPLFGRYVCPRDDTGWRCGTSRGRSCGGRPRPRSRRSSESSSWPAGGSEAGRPDRRSSGGVLHFFMSILAQAWREARPLHRLTFAAGALLFPVLFVVGLVYPVLAWGRPPGLSQDPLLRARLLLDEGRLDASVREYASGALVNRGDAHGLSEWGRALGKSGDANGELDALSRALRL